MAPPCHSAVGASMMLEAAACARLQDIEAALRSVMADQGRPLS